LERHWFADSPDEVVALLQKIDADFNTLLGRYPVNYVKSLTGVGYFGFRAATQIDPIWNAYLLALVIEIADDLEPERIPVSNGIIFSYRFSANPETGGIFDKSVGWRAFQETAHSAAKAAKYVLSTDISDF